MNWRSYLFHFYLDASIHVALSVFAFIEITCVFFGLSRDNHISYLVFFGTIACYNFVKYGVEAKKYFLVSNTYHKNIQVVSFMAGAFAVYHSLFVSFETWIGIAVLLVLTSLYAVPLLPNAKNLRSFGGLKIFIVALVWGGTTVVLPAVAAEMALDWDIMVELTQRFLMVLVLMLPFEIRDLDYDDPELRTLPQRFGYPRTKILGAAGMVVFFLLTFMKDHLTHLEVLGKGLVFFVLGGLLLVTKRNQAQFFSSFWVESVPIFWWACILVMDAFLSP
ncbi:hypothetical protein [Arenibacter sp. ARW7G5Y1]|uniref:hypothetical protein n=1 Tax=Arenibacter sp. ARW7G5Y1 TaxID=2135619 RepID=UPI000D767969|nr:hypothetical protein [Arenibacter sp. ARW7G5Y1]PXX23961.1 hypothetical protein C7972_11711 [Arenibacter sp. ARW7G5Y1]